MRHVEALREKGVRLLTIDRNATELYRIMPRITGQPIEVIGTECERVLAMFELVRAEDYEAFGRQAWARLDEGGKSDWPLLAAALAVDGEIWSDDRDFFGVGVPVWATRNVNGVEPRA